MFKWFKSTTVIGLLGVVASTVASPDVLALIPAQYAHLAVTAGAVLAAFGIRRRLPAP